ncbi:NUDIX hydrolase [Thermosipho melanesiensis]|uniref:NUDIX hydrolase n=1 Tax=Thermosipho melanesiensis (strain DSM 12029 / CIP 104789 / BI429) TaxID=391009 RepID=A6LP73_THEM4|nr:CoA pyrophosphatase [Thermosipho melanesiensis]ABR31724.1 NUDIX hydrolase [Thermosipho melanesiensis BI429]
MVIGANEYSILVPIIDKNYFLFEIRSKNIIQPGEVSFPGGKIEENETPVSCVIRETCEKIGTKPRIIKKMPLVVTPFNIVLHPFIGEIENKLNINKIEVETTFTAPIEIFKNPIYKNYLEVNVTPPRNFPFKLIPNGKNYNWRNGKYKVLFFKYKKHVIWGMTALIAHEAYKILKEGYL